LEAGITTLTFLSFLRTRSVILPVDAHKVDGGTAIVRRRAEDAA
jgi:hypothetical protein